MYGGEEHAEVELLGFFWYLIRSNRSHRERERERERESFETRFYYLNCILKEKKKTSV